MATIIMCRCRYCIRLPSQQSFAGDAENCLESGDFAFWTSQQYKAYVSSRLNHPHQVICGQLVNIIQGDGNDLALRCQVPGKKLKDFSPRSAREEYLAKALTGLKHATRDFTGDGVGEDGSGCIGDIKIDQSAWGMLRGLGQP